MVEISYSEKKELVENADNKLKKLLKYVNPSNVFIESRNDGQDPKS